MLAFAVCAALLGVTAWLILIGALIYGAVAAGVPWVIAAVAAIALHAVAVFLLVRAIRAMVENLTFAATRRTLSDADSAKVPDGSGA
jgi:TRAP-type C4-dicarboxylate transport system permease small subunit